MQVKIFREALPERQERLCEALTLARQTGHIVVNDYFAEEAIKVVEAEARRVPKFCRRRIGEWPNVERATMSVGVPRTSLERLMINLRSVENTRSRLRRVGLQAMHVEIIAPTVATLAKGLQTDIRTAAMQVGIDTLTDLRFNRAGFNYMYGTPADPAHITEHTDVKEELGLVAAINLFGQSPGEMHLILGANTVEHQTPHSIMASEFRESLTLAELEAPGR